LHAPTPQPIAKVPPLPNNSGERAVNVISVEEKAKGKMKKPVVVLIKKARVSKEASLKRDSMGMEDKVGTSRKDKKRKKRIVQVKEGSRLKIFHWGQDQSPTTYWKV